MCWVGQAVDVRVLRGKGCGRRRRWAPGRDTAFQWEQSEQAAEIGRERGAGRRGRNGGGAGAALLGGKRKGRLAPPTGRGRTSYAPL